MSDLDHLAEAQRFACTAATHLTEHPADMRIAEVAAWTAQAHALVALLEVLRPTEAAAPAMHVFGPEDGPTVTLVLPLRIVEDLIDAVYRYVPASSGIDGATVDELRHQLAQASPRGRSGSEAGA